MALALALTLALTLAVTLALALSLALTLGGTLTCAHGGRKPARLGVAQQHGTRAPLEAPPQRRMLRTAAAAAAAAAATAAAAGAAALVTLYLAAKRALFQGRDGQRRRLLAAALAAAMVASPCAAPCAGGHRCDEALLEGGGELAQLGRARQRGGARVQRRRGEALRGRGGLERA